MQNATGAPHRIAQGKGAAADTAWIDGRDPLYTAVADKWMAQVTEDFGSDHVWQMDGFFADGSGWGAAVASDASDENDTSVVVDASEENDTASVVPCAWSTEKKNSYLVGYVHGHSESFATLAKAKAAWSVFSLFFCDFK